LTFDILFCDSRKTHEINRDYREKDYPADIITFAIFADDEMKFVLDDDINLGEIIIALDKVQEEARKANVTDNYELYFLIAHGILHLLGFDHQTEEDYNFVVEVQKKALAYIGEKDV
jgi:probable rRNA maturation factor